METSSTRPQTYRFGPLYLALFGFDMLRGRRHSYARDGERLMARLARPPVLRGEENIPLAGPLVLAANHYQRRGLWVNWGAMLASIAVARRRGQDVRWVMAGEWRARALGPTPWPAPVLRWIFRRIAATLGHILMPAANGRSTGRARAVREMLRTLREGGVVGLLPEGRNSPGCVLRQPEPEVGRLLIELGREGAPALPVGLCELDGALVATFGPPVALPTGRSPEAALRARDEVMGAIARLLPEELRGAYGETAP